MNTAPLIAEIAGLVGEPARANMLTALLDGRALTAGELAYAARVAPPTASMHLAKLAEARLIASLKGGRCRYFRLASPRVAQMLEAIMAVAIDDRPRYRPLSRLARELRSARVCYDHLAGQLSVALADSMSRRGFILLDHEGAEVTADGAQFLAGFGIDLFTVGARRRRFYRSCLDWTERRPHIGGAVGAALASRCFELGWTERKKDSRAVVVTQSGRRGFQETFGVTVDAAPPQPQRPTGNSAAR
ncbi:MAG TPA: winged helix-turn-helix domain-containing protein [Stellaceae bacterium]|nr:winged helix-turn-helix domain-containing protein [Stellaceae bacterium]